MLIPNHYPDDPRFYLKSEFENRMNRRPFYSLRAFARDLEIGASTLSEFLSGKTGLSFERAQVISNKLSLDKTHREHFVDLVLSKYSKSNEKRAMARNKVLHRIQDQSSQVSIDEFKFISDWQHLAMLEYIELYGPSIDPGKAAKDLGLKKKVILETLVRLEKLKLISKEGHRYRVNSETTFTPNDVPSEAMKIYHRQLMQKAQMALHEQNLLEREFGHVLFSMNKSDIGSLKSDLRKMYLDLATKYNSRPNKNSIYCLGVQLQKICEAGEK